MQNDVLKNEIAPWQDKGRWYHFHMTEAGLDVNNSDKFIIDKFTITAGSGIFVLNDADYVIVEWYSVPNVSLIGSATSVNKTIRYYTDGTSSIVTTPAPNTYTDYDSDFYAFIVKRV